MRHSPFISLLCEHAMINGKGVVTSIDSVAFTGAQATVTESQLGGETAHFEHSAKKKHLLLL